MDEGRLIRRRIRFYGGVQGVGFRWRARSAARAAGATGWVRNEADGSVSMEVQGTEAMIDAVLQALDRGLYIRIERMDVETVPPLTDERGFLTLDDAW